MTWRKALAAAILVGVYTSLWIAVWQIALTFTVAAVVVWAVGQFFQ